MSESLCKNCKYWGAYKEGCCDFVDCIGSENPINGAQLSLYAHDDSGLEGWLVTAPEFGCVQFKEKEHE